MQKRLLSLVAMMMVMVSSVMAQVTTSALSGKVIADGEAVIGATIEAVHKPSGTRYNAVTNIKGMYTINGMRVGGPYEVKVSYIGFETKTYDNITLQLAETYNLSSVMTEDAKQLGEVVVVGKGTKFHEEKTGASTNISNNQILNMPSVSRSITDYTRLSPYGGNGMSFQGSDGRTANFTVDGSSFNNNFGLNSKLPGGGSPISIDAIDEMQVVISPYDVRQTNFIGGGVNAITKSGTNTFKGTAYIYHQNENMRGDAVDGDQITTARETDRTTTYGVTLGGPIIKDKLFFFVSGEMTKSPTQPVTWRGSEDGVADAEAGISRTTLADLQTVSDYVKQKYGYDTGSWTSFPADESNYKILARIDWNISNNHKLALRYNYTKNRGWNAPNASSMDGGSRMSGGRVSQYSMSYANSMYAVDNNVHSFSFDLNSRFGNNITNELLATYSKLDDVRFTNSAEFPFVDILKDGQAYISLGEELFTYHNAVHNTVWNIKDDVTWFLGNHKIMGGISYEHMMADNIYMRNGTGYYRYNSLDDFLTGATPAVVCLDYEYASNPDAAARVRYGKAGIYLQDEWDALSRLKITAGLRVDNFFFNNSDLMTNNAILKLDYNGRNIDTGKWPKSSLTFSPRLGFVWDVLGNKSLKVRGGTGLFQGRLPLVFFTNMPTNSGMVKSRITNKGFDLNEFAGGLITNRQDMINKFVSLKFPTDISPEEGNAQSAVQAVDPSFKMPQVWKSSIAVDYAFPTSFPLSLTGEFIYNKTINGVYVSDWSVPNIGGFARYNGADNRPIYPTGYRTNTPAYVVTNTSKGYGWSASVTLNAKPFEWMDFMAAYTHTVSKELTSMPGSDASSAFYYVPTVEGPSNIQLHDGINVEPDRIIASLSIHDKCCNHYSLIYETWRGGYNYSYLTTNDANGDSYNYDLVYVPTDQQVANKEFRFKTQDDADRFMAYVHGNKYLSDHQGGYTEPYNVYNPWIHRVDFSYKHDFKVNWGNTNHKLQLSCDIKNVLNLFNSSWGVAKVINSDFGEPTYNTARILKYEGVDADGYSVWSTPAAINGDTQTFKPYHNIGQCWYASIGVKYFFNGEKSDKGCGCKDVAFDNDALNALIAKNDELKAENNRLAAENNELRNRPAKVEKVVENKNVFVTDKLVVTFAQNSSELDDAAKAILDQVKAGSTITVVGATSPEGTSARNSELSVARAASVADYLVKRGVTVVSAEGNEAGRVAIVTIK